MRTFGSPRSVGTVDNLLTDFREPTPESGPPLATTNVTLIAESPDVNISGDSSVPMASQTGAIFPPVVLYIGEGTRAAATDTTLTPTIHASAAADSTHIAIVSTKNNDVHSTATAGWTKIAQSNFTTAWTTSVWRARGLVSNPVFTWTNSIAAAAQVFSFGPTDPTNDGVGAAGTLTHGSGTTDHATSGVTTTAPKSTIALLEQITSAAASTYVPGGYTQRSETVAVATRTSLWSAEVLASGASTGSPTIGGPTTRYSNITLELLRPTATNTISSGNVQVPMASQAGVIAEQREITGNSAVPMASQAGVIAEQREITGGSTAPKPTQAGTISQGTVHTISSGNAQVPMASQAGVIAEQREITGNSAVPKPSQSGTMFRTVVSYIGEGTRAAGTATTLTPTVHGSVNANSTHIAIVSTKNNDVHSTATPGWVKVDQGNLTTAWTTSIWKARGVVSNPVFTWANSIAAAAQVFSFGPTDAANQGVGATGILTHGTGLLDHTTSGVITTAIDSVVALMEQTTTAAASTSDPTGFTKKSETLASATRTSLWSLDAPSSGTNTGSPTIGGTTARYSNIMLEILAPAGSVVIASGNSQAPMPVQAGSITFTAGAPPLPTKIPGGGGRKRVWRELEAHVKPEEPSEPKEKSKKRRKAPERAKESDEARKLPQPQESEKRSVEAPKWLREALQLDRSAAEEEAKAEAELAAMVEDEEAVIAILLLAS